MAYRGKISDPFYHTDAWKAVRRQALERDHGVCQICLRAWRAGSGRRPRNATIVHHLKPRSQYPDLSLELDNLESVCAICHNQVHPEKGAGADKLRTAQPTRAVRIITI